MLLWAVVLFLFALGLATTAYAAFRAAPWVPVRSVDLPRVVRLLDLKPGETLYDLGCGDGRVLLASWKPGVRGVGIELSLPLVLASTLRIFFRGRSRDVRVHVRDFFHVSLREADAIFCFLMPPAMAKLAEQFKRDLKPGCRIVSYTFSLPGWKPEVEDRTGGTGTPIYRYRLGT